MVLSWSRAIYVEFVRRADVTTFMRCHVNAFEFFGGVPRRCLYDNAKVVVLGRDDGGRASLRPDGGPQEGPGQHRLDRRMRIYLAPKVFIVYEFGIWPYDRDAATAFFSLVSARYERGSIILTSNKGFAERGELLGDTVIATAILDRLLHHSHVLNIRGES